VRIGSAEIYRAVGALDDVADSLVVCLELPGGEFYMPLFVRAAAGVDVDDALRARRRTALLAAFAETRPDAVILESFPFGRRAFRFELDPLSAAVRETGPRPRLICSVRDIVVLRDDPARHRGTVGEPIEITLFSDDGKVCVSP